MMEAMLSDFKIGDRVRSILHPEFGIGTIIVVSNSDYGVLFDNKYPFLHDLEGNCESQRGWYCDKGNIKLAEIKVKNTRLARKMYPKAKEDSGYLLIEV